MSQSSRYAQRALSLSREVEAKDARIAELLNDVETLESTIALQQITIENLKQPKIQYWPGMGDK